jgi:hypothetical protein
MLALIASFAYSAEARKANTNPCIGIVGDEQLLVHSIVPYLGGRGPGDQIGTTAYDYQANGPFGQRILVDDYDQAHIDWMWQDYPGQSQRYCAWNARFSDASYYGETQASNSWSGYVQLDVTQDANPDDQRTAVVYHFDPGSGYYGWVDLDGGNLWGTWPNNPVSPQVADHIWPYNAMTSNNNMVMVAHGYPVPGDNHIYAYSSTDGGSNWNSFFSVDSCAAISQFVRSSRNAGSHKVVVCWTMFITDSVASGQLDNNVWYILSTDDGATWGSPTNITTYQPSDSVRAYTDVNAVFDANDDLHVAWTGRRVTDNYYEASKVFHWDEVSGSITVINSPSTFYTDPGGWWIESATGGDYGGWRLPADQPQLIVDLANNDLYCMWHGNADYNDASAGGFINCELYGSVSYDGGATWRPYVNLTNTHSPGGAPGACEDEDYATACPYVVNDTIFITYIEDKDAGGVPQSEGTVTENPVRCWLVHKSAFVGIEENNGDNMTAIVSLAPNPSANASTIRYALANHGIVRLDLFDATGRTIQTIDNGYKNAGIHAVQIQTGDLSNGSYFVVLNTPDGRYTDNLIVVH